MTKTTRERKVDDSMHTRVEPMNTKLKKTKNKTATKTKTAQHNNDNATGKTM